MSSDPSSHPVTTRKGRGQSKKGCLTCKSRRVKCDEVHPVCSTCSRRRDACVWTEEPNNALQVLPRVARMALKPSRNHQLSVLPLNDFRLKELELLHHWTTSTLFTCIPDLPTFRYSFQISLPQIAFQHKSLLHALFAVASLHMHHLYPSFGYLPLAKMHCQHSVLSLYSTPANSAQLEASVMADILLATYWLAFPAWESTLSDVVPDVFDWLPAAKKFMSRIDFYKQSWAEHNSPSSSIVAPMVLDYEMNWAVIPFPETFMRIYHPEVCPYDREELEDERYLAAYEAGVLAIRNCTWESFMTPRIQTLAMYGFLMLVPDDFFKLFMEKRPRALIIVAHYCSILGQFDGVWWYSWERFRHDLQHILSLLDEKWLPFIEYPLNVLAMKDQPLDGICADLVGSSSVAEVNGSNYLDM
ncbi:hypothetical protein DL96DRAFT_1621817 [Flagelloscypha sp. PMI_526]|nr:hypothetical protein DL96DRAFT_1621817 [Flagelloscypha sp. PMI_526]